MLFRGLRSNLLLALLLLGQVIEAWAEPAAAQAWRVQQGIGVARDERHALTLYREAAQAGSIEAQAYLAQALQSGALGITSMAEAEYWQGQAKLQMQCPSTIRHPSDLVEQAMPKK